MSGFPTFLVKLDDGTGTFPYDITQYVETQHGWSINPGRPDEHGDVTPTVLSLALNNTDGRFTLGSTSGGYGAINLDRMIRWTETVGATTSQRFTGYVQDWPVEWPGGGEAYSIARVTAVDRLARLARRKFRSVLEMEILADGPEGYYTLAESAGAPAAGDASGTGGPLVVQRLPGDFPVTFGESLDLVGADGLTAMRGPAAVPGDYLEGFISPISTSVTVEGVMLVPTDTPGSNTSIVVLDGALRYVQVRLSESGGVAVPTAVTNVTGATVTVTGASVTADVAHHLAATWNGTTLELLVDGTSAGTAAASATATFTLLQVSGAGALTAHAAVRAGVLSSSRILIHAQAALLGLAGDTSDARLTRLAAYAGIDAADLTLDAGLLRSMSAATGLRGNSALAAMQQVEASEGGLIIASGNGKIVFQNRNHRRSQAAAAASFVAADLGPDLRPVSDMAQVRNDVTGTRPSGAEQRAVNQASLDAHEQYPDSIELQVLTDQEVRDRIDWIAGVYAEPQPRIPGLTVDILSQTQAKQEAVLALEIGDRIDLSGLPTQAPSSGPQIIEGWTESGSEKHWSITFNTSPFEFSRAWILGDSTYGVLDSTTRLGY